MLKIKSLKQLVSDRQIFAWAMYDWANSAYSTIVITALLGPYFSRLIKKIGNNIAISGFLIDSDAFYPFCVSISVIFQAIFLPFLGAVADEFRIKKFLMVSFAISGAFFTCLLGMIGWVDVNEQTIKLLGVIFIFSNFCFGASVALSNGFLLELSSKKLRDRISSFGFALGYLGGGLALLLSLSFFCFYDNAALSVKLSFIFAGLWWLIFTIFFPARYLKEQRGKIAGLSLTTLFFPLKRLYSFFVSMLKSHQKAVLFLIAYLFYNDGVQTVIVVASIFATSELHVTGQVLLYLILFIQIVAFIGAVVFGLIGEKIGTKDGIIFSLVIWILILLYAYFCLTSIKDLFILSFFVAIVLGGTQALSRSLFSKLISPKDEAQFFSLYEIGEKGSSWLGPFIFALTVQFTGDAKTSMLSILIFFILGLVILHFVEE